DDPSGHRDGGAGAARERVHERQIAAAIALEEEDEVHEVEGAGYGDEAPSLGTEILSCPHVRKDCQRQVEDLGECGEDERERDAARGALREVVPGCMRNSGSEEQRDSSGRHFLTGGDGAESMARTAGCE